MDIEANWFQKLQGVGPPTGSSLPADFLALQYVFVILDEPGVERDVYRTIPDISRLEKYVFRFPVDSAIVLMICRGMDSGY